MSEAPLLSIAGLSIDLLRAGEKRVILAGGDLDI
jgi:hypothetical protein